MKENKNTRANYCLAASLRGERLMVTASLKKEMEQEFQRDLRQLEHRGDDRMVFRESLEQERFGDFLLRTGSRVAAVKAYIQAACCCLDGAYYESCDSRGLIPARMLRIRFANLADKIESCCAADARLKRIAAEDRWFQRMRKRYLRDL